jgi:hypothetical protein
MSRQLDPLTTQIVIPTGAVARATSEVKGFIFPNPL